VLVGDIESTFDLLFVLRQEREKSRDAALDGIPLPAIPTHIPFRLISQHSGTRGAHKNLSEKRSFLIGDNGFHSLVDHPS
jgi:hypothetical protein